MKKSILLLLTCAFASCAETRFRENYPNGVAKFEYVSRGDHGTTTGAVLGNSGSSTGLPVIGSRSKSEYDIVQAETSHLPSVTIGDNFKQTGTMTHSTMAGVLMKGGVGMIREGVLGLLGWKVAHTMGNVENTKTTSDVAKSRSKDGVKMNDSNNALEGLKSDNSTKVELEALKLE